MALNFPASPAVDDTFTDGETTWRWNGTAWIVDAGTAATPNSFTTFVADTGTTTADTTADTLTVSGGIDIETSITNDELTVNFTGTIPPATNSFATVNSDAGNVTAANSTDTLTIAGGTNVDTSVSGNTLTINATVPTPTLNINDLTDVDTVSTPPVAGNVLKWDGNHWAPGTDIAQGGTGTDADTFDGFDSTYFLNYNNLANKPTIPADLSDLTDTTNLIPADLSDLTDTTNLIPADLSDLTDTTNLIPADLSDLTDTTNLIPADLSDLTDTSNLIPDSLLDLSITDGSSGQVLTTDGAGNFTFQTISSGGANQNIWATFNGDAGTTTANTTTDTFTFTGGTNINTTVVGDSVRIDMPAALGVSNYDDLSEVQRTGRTIDKSYMPAFAMLRMNNAGNTAYTCDSHGYTGNNPTLNVIAGMTIAFDLDQVGGHPFLIQDATGTDYSTGLVHVDIIGNVSTGVNAQGKDGGTLYWEVPETISGTYRYQCSLHPAMVGGITIKRISVI